MEGKGYSGPCDLTHAKNMCVTVGVVCCETLTNSGNSLPEKTRNGNWKTKDFTSRHYVSVPV